MDTIGNIKLGDMAAKALEPLKKLGLVPPDCNCDMRQDWLNSVPSAFMKGGFQAARAAHDGVMEYYSKPR